MPIIRRSGFYCDVLSPALELQTCYFAASDL